MPKIDKIYSRPRLKLPRLRKLNNRNAKKLYYFVILWITVIVTLYTVMNSIGPIFEKVCLEKSKEIGTKILNSESTEVLKGVDYNDLIKVEKDDNSNIKMVKSNVVLINLLASDITYRIQEKLSELKKVDVKIAMGALMGSRMLAGIGPSINIRIVPIGSVETEFKSEFVSAGINQTIHRLYLLVKCEVNVLTSYNTIDAIIENQILFAENIIVGDIPDSYYNLEGIGKDDVMEVIN